MCALLQLAATAVVLGFAAPGHADAVSDVGRAVERVGAIAAHLSSANNYGYDEGISLLGAFIRPGADCSINVELNEGVRYVFAGAGDDDARDVDIIVRNSAGTVVAKDTDADPTPIAVFTPDSTGIYTVSLKLYRARAGATGSFCAMVQMRRDGWTIPEANLHASAAQCLAAASGVGRVANNRGGRARFYDEVNRWSLMGAALRSGEECSITLPGAGRHNLLFLAGGDSFAKEVAMRLESGGRTLEEYDENRPYAVFAHNTASGSRYKLVLKNTRSTKPTFLVSAIVDLIE